MKREYIDNWLRIGALHNKQKDLEKIKSIINSVDINAQVTKAISLNYNTATLVFREIYESIRQLGDAKWGLLGFEPCNHEVSMEVLKVFDIKDKVKLNSLDRFKKIRHDANYKGFKVLASQAREIIEFWDKCGKEVIDILKKQL